MSIAVYENFCPNSFVEGLNEYFTYRMKWGYVHNATGENEISRGWNVNCEESPMMCRLSYQNEVHHEETINEIKPLLWFLEKETGMEVTALDRIKSNLYVKNETWKDKMHPPHTDSGRTDALTLLYYVNDSDGPTYFFDTKITDRNPQDGKVIAKIYPKAGTGVVFESNRYHAGTLPTEHPNRMVINIVFSAKNYNLQEASNVDYLEQTDSLSG